MPFAGLVSEAKLPDRSFAIVGKWATGQTGLAPLTAVEQHILYCGETSLGLLDPATPAHLWQMPHELPGGAVFRPRTLADRVICGGRHVLGAWQINDGKPLWRHVARQQLGAPCLHRGSVFCGDGHELVALDSATGSELWRFAAVTDTLISYAPAAAGDTILVGPGDGCLYALDASDGHLRWSIDRMSEWQYLRQLHVSGDVLVAGSYKEKLYGLDISSGRQLWEFSAGNFINSHHVASGVAYLWSPTGWLYAIDAQSGSLRWRHRTTDYGGRSGNWAAILAELVVQADRLYALDLGHVLHVLDTGTGEEIVRQPIGYAVRPFVLALTSGQLMLATQNGDLLLVKLS